MMKLFLFVYLFLYLRTEGQVAFQKVFAGTTWINDEGFCVRQTSDSGYIVLGNYYDNGIEKIHLIKTNINGDTIWTKLYGGNVYNRAYSLQQTSDGGYIIVGTSTSFTTVSSGTWIIKADYNGNILWTKCLNNSLRNEGLSIQQTGDGGYIITGKTGVNGGYFDAWLLKTDTIGNIVWIKQFQTLGSDAGNYVQQTSDGGYIIAGHTQSFGGNWDIYIIKTNSNGDSLWIKTLDGGAEERASSIRQTTDGGYIITGFTESFGAGNEDVFLIKLDSFGNIVWQKTYGGVNLDKGNCVIQTTDGFAIVGTTYSFGFVGSLVCLIKTDIVGNLIWTKLFGYAGSSIGNFVEETFDGGYIITGQTNYDIYLIKTDSLGNSGCNEASATPVLTNPAIFENNFTIGVSNPITTNVITAQVITNGLSINSPCTNVGIALVSNSKLDVLLSPNPTAGSINLRFFDDPKATIVFQLIELTGKIVYIRDFPEGTTEQIVELPPIAAGIYNCFVTNGSNRICRKLVVQ